MQSLTNHASFGTLNPELLTVELSDELQKARNYLRSLATSPDYVTKMQVAFSNNFDLQKVEELTASWVKGDFGNFPQIEMRDAAEINGARGAFAAATNTIYLSREFVRENEGSESAIASVLLEEYGHYIDSQINAIDSAGDEGEIFADIAQGKVLSESKLAALKGEDDSAIVVLDGEEVRIEQAETTSQTDKLDFFAGEIKDWGTGIFSNKLEPKKIIDGQKEGNFDIPLQTVDLGFLKFDREVKSSLDFSLFASMDTFGNAKFDYPVDLTVQIPKQVELGETFSIRLDDIIRSSSASFNESATKGFELPNAGLKFEFNVGKIQLNNFTFDPPLSEPKKIDGGIDVSLGKAEINIDVDTFLASEANRLLQLGGFGNVKVEKAKIEEEFKPISRDISDPKLPDIAAKATSNNLINADLDLDEFLLNLIPGYRAASVAGKLSGIELKGLGFEISIPSSAQEEGRAEQTKENANQAQQRLQDAKRKLENLQATSGLTLSPEVQQAQQDVQKAQLEANATNDSAQLFERIKDVAKKRADGERVRVSASGDLLDLKANIGLAFQQDFIFDPDNVVATMSLDDKVSQPSQNFDGSNQPVFQFTAPSTGSGVVKVKAQYELKGEVKNYISPALQGSLNYKAVQLAVQAQALPLQAGASFGPLLQGDLLKAAISKPELLSLVGSPKIKDSDPDPAFKILKAIKTNEIGGSERDDKTPDPNATKNIIVEVEYKIPFNLPFSISDAQADEGNNLVFKVSRREASNESVTLIVEYTDQSAVRGQDYSPTQTIMTIPGGQLSADVTVSTSGNNKPESNKTFKVTLKKQDGTEFAPEVPTIDATGTIIDDDEKPDQPKEGGKTYNDPRIVTLDKQYHDFQAVGEFVLVESTSGDLKIQVRQEALGSDRLGSVSENTAVATVLAGQRIGIYRDRGLLINGNPTTIANNDSIIIGDGRIYREGGQYTIVYGTGDQLVASVSSRVNVSFFAKEERQGQIKGLLGNFNRDPKDDLTKRDGTVITPPVTLSQLYNEYADSWRINQAESLFDYQPGQDTNTFTNRNFPRKKVTLRDLDPADIRRAELAIGDRIPNPIVREAAIIDYILTGFDESIIEEAIASLTPESTLAIVTPTQAFDDFAATTVNTPIKIDVTSNDDRTIGVPIAIANFDQTSTAGSIIRLDDNNTPDDKTDDQLIYTPTANFTGNDTFNYTVTDGTQTSTAKVTVNIANLNLSTLNGSNGFTLNGINPGNFAGVSVNTLKDFNGDGFNDFIIGAFAADPNNNNAAGETYVVFGKQGGFPASIDLPKLDGSNGFILNGIDTNGFSGGSVSSAGDINGDGLDDLVIGAFGATANGQNNAGKAYVVFGAKGVYPARLNLSDLNGNNGFVVNGVNEFDYLGLAVSSAGDINADGIDDLLVSAPGPLNGTLSKSYVIYGQKGNFAPSLNSSDINGSNGFVINDNDGKSGTSVSAAGDINGDGIDDIIINAEENDSNNYVVFGSANRFAVNFNLSELNGSNGFIFDTLNEKSGTTVSKAGDINGDTIDDLIISLASSNSNAGKTYILLGSKQGFAPRFDVSQFNGRNGFALVNNIDGNSISSVSGAGDINGDGIEDLAISASQANSNAGKTYILFGDNAGFTPTFYLSRINGNNGLVINGVKEDDLSGTSLSQGGDINGDNIDDLMIGSPGNLFNNSPGQTHVVFGSTLFGSSKDDSNLAKLLFDSRYYLTQNPDVREAVSNGLFRSGFEHFIKLGFDERRSPSQLFADDYLTNNPDVNAAVKNGIFHSGFEHFIKAGFAEGRQPDTILDSLASLEVFYLSENPDVQAAIKQGIVSSGLEHLIRLGMFEGRSPFSRLNALSETFNAEFYLVENPDVKQAVDSGIFRSALEHFVNVGLFEGRNPGSQFSNSSYLANYPDIADAVSNGIFRSGYEHFIKFGFGEERFGVESSFGR